MSSRETRIEPVRDEPAATRFEDGHTQVFGTVSLPHSLALEYERVRDLTEGADGAEARLMLAREKATGELRVVKLYRRRFDRVDGEMLNRIRAADKAHVVRIEHQGIADGVRYEVQEYCERGSLRDLITGALDAETARSVLVELRDALVHIHGLGCVHRDIKPENVLVRGVSPLDLVLADFGVSTVLRSRVEFRSETRTIAYAAPEQASGVTSFAADWWALGMIVAELRLGRHPLANASGEVPADVVIQYWIHTRRLDFAEIPDQRWRLLCRGLTVRDPELRWGADEVTAWLAGDSPKVAEEPAGAGERRAEKPFRFLDKRTGVEEAHQDPRTLALALATSENWDDAATLLDGSRGSRAQMMSLRNFLGALGIESSFLGWDDPPEIRLIRLLQVLDPDFPPVFQGADLGREGLADLARSDQTERLQVIAEIKVLEAWSSQESYRDYKRIQERWLAEARAFENLAMPITNVLEADDIPRIRDRLRGEFLLASVDDRARASLRERAEAIATDEDALLQRWFRSSAARLLRAEPSAGRDHLLVLLGERARVTSEAQAEERRAKAAAERAAQLREARAAIARDVLMGLAIGAIVGGMWIWCAAEFTARMPGSPLGSEDWNAARDWTQLLAIAFVVVTVLGRVVARSARLKAGDARGAAAAWWAPGLAGIGGSLAAAGACTVAGGGYLWPEAWPLIGVAGIATELAALVGSVFERALVRLAGVLVILGLAGARPALASRSHYTVAKTVYERGSLALIASVPMKGCSVPKFQRPERPRQWIAAEATCSEGGVQARFVRFADPSALARYTSVRRTDGTGTPKVVLRTTADRCGRGASASGPWVADGKDERLRGTLICRRLVSRVAVIEWSEERGGVWASVRSERSLEKLAAWWRRHRVLS